MADLRFALRQLWKSPAFTALAVLTLALGIGANTAIFSVVESVLLRPLPFRNADRLVRVYDAVDEHEGAAGNTLNLSVRTVRQWREHGREIFDDLAAATGMSVTVGGADGSPARNAPAASVSANFFPVLGLSPTLGRSFTADEDRPGGERVVIVSHDFWQSQLAGRADVIGESITLDGARHRLVGVMPKSFRHPYRAEVWLPLALDFTPTALPANHYLYGVARLRPDVTPAQAEGAVRRMCAAINGAAPDPNNARRAYLPRLRESFVMDLRPKLLVIIGAALCALLVAAANFSGLLLARVIEREGEFALRAALGAGRWRLIRQELTQALLLATLGTGGGLLLASWLTPALVAFSPEGADATGSAMREFDYTARFDWPVFVFATGAMCLVGIGFGLLPALRASRTDLRSALSGTARGANVDRGTRRLLGSLVVGELAVAAALLMASVTLTQYFRKLIDEPWGFATDHRLAFSAMFSERLFATPEARGRAAERALEELRALPGMRAATVTSPSPMNAPRQLMTCNTEGAPPPEPSGFRLAYLRAALPGYFNTVGQRLVRGRDFTDTDRGDSPPVCIVNESFARRFWPGAEPIGKRVKWGRLDGPRPHFTVIGVAGDTKTIADPRDGEVAGTVALPLAQVLRFNPSSAEELTFVLHANIEPAALTSAVRAAISRADSRMAAYGITPLDEAATLSWVTERFVFLLVSLFGVLGLALAAIGLYGVLALQVARRTREFGIRIALGATAGPLIRLVATEGAKLLGVGFALGGLGILLAIRIVHHYWPEAPAADLSTAAVAGAVLAATVGIACWFPARRASRVDPIVALHSE